jgi:ADP-ribose pyrophosphatase
VSPTFRSTGEQPHFTGHLISVVTAGFEAPDGTPFSRDVVRHPGAVSVVPLRADRTVLMVRQFRAAIAAELLEIPAGKRDVAGESPEVTAHRELAEEVGVRAGELHRLASFYNSPGFCDEYSTVFLALDLEDCATDVQGIEERYMTVEEVAWADVPALIADGAITDAKSIIGLCLAREVLGA